jgi:hypothetical protein
MTVYQFPAPALLTYHEVEGILRVSRHTLWRMATKRNELVQVKVGARALITRESVESFLGRPLTRDDLYADSQ